MKPLLGTLGWLAGWALLCVAVPWMTGCAVGVIRPDGTVLGAALGRARIEHCEPVPTPLVVVYGLPKTPTPRAGKAATACDRIAGGSLSGGVADALDAAITALAAYFGIGG